MTSPLLSLERLRELDVSENRVRDIASLRHLSQLEELDLRKNPLSSLTPLEQLPKLRSLSISTDQVPCLFHCKRLPSLQVLEICGEQPIENVAGLPEMPGLKVLEVASLQDTAGIERFTSLETLELTNGNFSRLDEVGTLGRLTHLRAWTNSPLSLQPLGATYALRRLDLSSARVTDLRALDRLPVLHEIVVSRASRCDWRQLKKLCEALTPWETEFKGSRTEKVPSLELDVVSESTFDLNDTGEAFGIQPGEVEAGMFREEREWVCNEIRTALKAHFPEYGEDELLLPGKSGLRRSETLVAYSIRAYESFRAIVTTIQSVLCATRNDWIIYFQSLLEEGLDAGEVPAGIRDFIVWVYPDKIMATKECAATIEKLIQLED